MEGGDALAKLILYFFTIQKHSNRTTSVFLGGEVDNALTGIYNLINQIEASLILFKSTMKEKEAKDVDDDMQNVWDETYNYVFPMLILNQLSLPISS